MCTYDAQSNAAAGQFSVQFMQHVRACEVDIRRGREIADGKADDRGSGLANPVQDCFDDRVGIDVDQRGLGTKNDRVR